MLTYYLALTSMFILTWATMYPQDALSVIAELKRQQRLRVIHNAGAECAKELAQDLNEFADHMGIDRTLANEVLEQNHDMIVERLGSKYTDELLGEPDPNERYD